MCIRDRYINIPSNALTGKTVMRVQMSDVDDPSSGRPCYTTAYGETEDYSVYISAALQLDANEVPLAAAAENKKAISVNPNPVANGANVTVNYTSLKQGKTTLKVVDMYGRIVQATELGSQK